jgi:catechol 2,3-dioxygenase-like lactoylglutathione lyase family enzyme
MIQRMSHSAIFVLDQDVAKDFYVNKLGFELKMDESMPNGFRWLTVNPKGQPDLEIILMKVAPSPFEGTNPRKIQQEDVGTIAELMKKGAFGAGVFQTADCRKTYEELRAIRQLVQHDAAEEYVANNAYRGFARINADLSAISNPRSDPRT